MPDDDKFLGKSYVLEDHVTIARAGPKLEFYAFEWQGLTAYRKAPKTWQWWTWWFGGVRPITRDEDLKPGMTVYFSHPFAAGEYWACVVAADRESAEGESVSVSMKFDPGLPEHGIGPEWVGTCFLNMKAVQRVQFC